MKKLNKIHVILHKLGISTKAYKEYMQNLLDESLWENHLSMSVEKKCCKDNCPYSYEEVSFFWWEFVQYFKRYQDIDMALDELYTEYIDK